MNSRISLLGPGSLFVLFASPFASGCAASDRPAASDEAALTTTPVELEAELSEQSLDDVTATCKVAATFFTVRLQNPAAEKAINAVLTRTLRDFQTGDDCVSGTTPVARIEARMAVALNDKGILSLREAIHGQTDARGRPLITFRAFQFVLETGHRLELTDILQEPGLSELQRACQASGTSAERCRTAIETRESFLLEPGGIWLNADDRPPQEFGIGPGVHVPWNRVLRDNIQHPVVRKLAGG
jgi:hypothetical protein